MRGKFKYRPPEVTPSCMPDVRRSAVLLLACVQAFTNAVALAAKPTTCELASETSIREVFKGFGIFTGSFVCQKLQR